jgi:predicted RNase H-like HicB family nuclease
MNVQVLIWTDDTGLWSATVPDLPGCMSSGETEEEVRRNIVESIELYLHGEEASELHTRKLVTVTVPLMHTESVRHDQLP